MSGNLSQRICSTCLCEDRKLFQLCRVPDGVNLLYMLLMCDTDAYREGFFTDTASWMVCWECRAIIKRIRRFQLQTCTAMTRLKDVANSWNKEIKLQSLSCLSTCINQLTVIETDTFVDCHLNKIKTESTEDLQNSCNLEDNLLNEPNNSDDTDTRKVYRKTEKRIKTVASIKEFYTVTVMDSDEFKNFVDLKKLLLNNVIRCNSCVVGFENESEINAHNIEHHTMKENHSICNLCLTYIKNDVLDKHVNKHYQNYVCNICNYRTDAYGLMVEHLKEMHRKCIRKKKKQLKKKMKSDEPLKYPCSECDMTFENKGAKWKHVQKCHRDGHQCGTCQKVFSFKHNLQRHELSIHAEPPARAQCPQCHKQVRAGVLRAHERTHAPRARAACAPCGKAFACRATYETHLKYAAAHAARDSRKHACSSCDKKFRSRGELRDHVAYRHEERASYKCPVCDKSLATRRCVTRHVRRAHDGIKENARDKICDYCGKAFRDKQSLSEHVFRHTGARPLTCARCGRAFRQRAALHAHMRRLHPDT